MLDHLAAGVLISTYHGHPVLPGFEKNYPEAFTLGWHHEDVTALVHGVQGPIIHVA